MATRLEEIHQERQTPAYWEALLLPWLAAWIENLYDRYLRLREVRETLPGARFEMPRITVPPALYGKSCDVWGHAHLHSANARIYALLIDVMGLSGAVQSLEAVVVDDDKSAAPRASQKLKALIFRHIRAIARPDPFRRAGFPWRELKDDSLNDDGFERSSLDRLQLRLGPADDEFETILGALMPQALPISLFEEYRSRRAYADRFMQLNGLKTIVVSSSLWSNDSIKYVMAGLRAANGRVVARQHGAGYGCFETITPERVERRLADRFISWGWDDERSCPVVPLPEPRLSEIADKHRQESDDILFVGSQGPMYMFRYQSYWIPEFVLGAYWPMQETFFRRLSESLRASLVYKPFHQDYGWGERARVSRVVPGMRFDESSGAIKGMQRSKLVVIDHPGTSLLQALAMNAPTVAFWNPSQCPMRSEAYPYFALLREVGILHDGPEQAARHVGEIGLDPRSWWSNSAVQAARKRFCRRFAWSDPHWETMWRNALGAGAEICGNPSSAATPGPARE